jgi:HEAT repeat protein
MKKRRWLWLVAVLAAAAVVAVLIPGSPVYLPDFFLTGGQYDGRPTRHWIRELNNANADERRQAIHALGAIGADAPEAVSPLAAIMLEDADRETRIEAALALTKMGKAARPAVPALARALADEEPFVRMNAALALLRQGEEARPAVPALIQALKDDANRTNCNAFTCTIQEVAALALGRASAGTADAVAALTEALEAATTIGMRTAAARALGDVGAAARPAAPQLRALLKDKDAAVRDAAQEALRKIEGDPEAAPPGQAGADS